MMILFITSCSFINNSVELTDNQVLSYISTYKELREKAPAILEQVNQNPKNSDIGLEKYKEIESIITNGGFRSFQEFVLINAKIGAVFSLIQADKSINTFDEMNKWGNQAFDDGIAEYERLIADPNTTEEMKKEYEKGILELQKAKNEVNQNFEYNKKWANTMKKAAEKISGLLVTESDFEIVKKYEADIYDAYSGFKQPELPENQFPKLDIGY